jgi:predicted dehydrogenase
MKKINVVLVGLGFGGAFVDIYKHHPNVASIGLYDINRELAKKVANNYDILKIYGSFEEILNDNSVDAVHLVTPIPLHEQQTIQVLEAGKHCACTVPMAISLDGIKRITEAVRKSGKNYMMMETTLYTYQFFYIKKMIENGMLGKMQFIRGSHYQDMVNWPDYWMGLPPMYYGTHAIGPMVALSGSRIKRVNCFGSGTMEAWLTKKYNNPFPMECALFEFENGLKGEATRSLFETARVYQEGLFVYGSNACFEWGFADNDAPYVTKAIPAADGRRGGSSKVEKVQMLNFHHYLPQEIQRFTVGGNYDPLNPQDSLMKDAGAGHHGSHPHLVNEFVMSVIENRKPWIDEILGGNINAAGICAHASAMDNGSSIEIPFF